MGRALSPIALSKGRNWSRTHLELPANLPFAEWVKIGRTLGRAEAAISWWIGDWWAFGKHHYGERAEIVRSPAWQGPGFQACADNAWVCRQFETSRRREVLTFTHHREVADQPRQIADRLLSWAERNRKSVRELRAEVFRLRSLGNRTIPEDGCTVDDLVQLAESGKRFATIYADPPWTFDVFGALGKDRSAEKHYDTLSVEEIKALPVAPLAADDSVLLIWAIMPELRGALAAIEAWGFAYKTCGFSWAKLNPSGEGFFTGLGYWTRSNIEICLLATRGQPQRVARDVAQLIVAPRAGHSVKPDEITTRIERLVAGPYLELYARKPRRGWWVWGNEIARSEMEPAA